MSSLEADFLQRLELVLGPPPVSLHEPVLGDIEGRLLQECVSSGYVSSIGPFVTRFESDLEAVTGARNAVAVVNGTSALQIALILAGVRPGDEVIMPALTFVATAAAAAHCGATPHFVDSDSGTLGLSPEAFRRELSKIGQRRHGVTFNKLTGSPIRAVVPVHVFGHPCDMSAICAVADEFGLSVVEDAAEALGSQLGGQPVGTFGACGVLSFNGNKIVTTGGGGAILTGDDELAQRAKHLTTTAKTPHPWEYVHDEVGFNFRMPNVNAALGCAQLEQLGGFLMSKRELYSKYSRAFQDSEDFSVLREPPNCRSNYWLQTIILQGEAVHHRDRLINAAHSIGIGVRPAWRNLHTLAPYSHCPRGALDNVEELSRRIINVPSGAALVQKVHRDRLERSRL